MKNKRIIKLILGVLGVMTLIVGCSSDGALKEITYGKDSKSIFCDIIHKELVLENVDFYDPQNGKLHTDVDGTFLIVSETYNNRVLMFQTVEGDLASYSQCNMVADKKFKDTSSEKKIYLDSNESTYDVYKKIKEVK